ncbi:MAG: hypothetical protein O7D30_03850 [Rickettsia endosymbiont of Ixodes persulcatus]|nr:hypothetical protein [Rickettsia endosymbiont of Ixodes persulcatus]
MGLYYHGFDLDSLVNNDTIKKLKKIVTIKELLLNCYIVVRYELQNKYCNIMALMYVPTLFHPYIISRSKASGN